MRELINLRFKGGEKQFTVVTKSVATWADDKNKFKAKFDKDSLKLAINFLLDNFFSIFIICHFDKSWNLHGL